MLSFEQFKESRPVRVLMIGLGPVNPAGEKRWIDVLDGSPNYESFRRNVIANNAALMGQSWFVKAVTRRAGTCSTGELNLLYALCCLCDFGHVADEVSCKLDAKVANKTWSDIYASMDEPHAAVLAACIYHAASA